MHTLNVLVCRGTECTTFSASTRCLIHWTGPATAKMWRPPRGFGPLSHLPLTNPPEAESRSLTANHVADLSVAAQKSTISQPMTCHIRCFSFRTCSALALTNRTLHQLCLAIFTLSSRITDHQNWIGQGNSHTRDGAPLYFGSFRVTDSVAPSLEAV